MRRCAIVLIAGSFLVGCQTPLDIRQTELIQVWGEGNQAFVEAIDKYRIVMDGIATNYHESQRDLRNKEWELWLSRHTQDDGSLVSDDNGTIVPMKVAQLETAIQLRDKASRTIADSERLWKEQDTKIKKAIEDFRVMTRVAMETNADIAEAKKSAQQFIESALSALGGMAAGFGLSIAVAP